MAFRSDVTVDYSVSPRIITVASPSVTISIQDLHDTLQEIQDDIWNLTFPNLVTSAGKQPLTATTLVGITLELQDAKLAFEARPGPATIQCIVDGGNLVAVDSADVTTNPIHPTAFTQVVVAQSTSPSIIRDEEHLTVGKFLALKDT